MARSQPKRVDSEALQYFLHRAIKLQQAGDFTAAEHEYRNILLHKPDHTDALQFLAVLLQQNQDPSAALYFIKKALKSDPQNTQIILNQAEIYRAQGKMDKAQQCAEKALAINPELADAFVILGYVYSQNQQLQKAEEHFLRALELNPEDASVHNELGNVLCLLDRNQDAVEHYHKAIQIYPDFHDCRVNLADTLLESGDLKNAIAHYQTVLDHQPKSTSVLTRLGAAYEKSGNTKQAALYYKRVVDSNPEQIDARLNLGRVLMTSDPQLSEHYLRSVMDLDADNADGQYWLGIHAQTMGNFLQATRYFQQAIHLKPGFADAWHRLSLNRGYKPDRQEIEMLEQQCRDVSNNNFDDPDLIAINFTLGRFYEQKENHEKAFHYYQQGNKQKTKKLRFDRKEHHHQVNDIMSTFDEAFFTRRQGWGNPSQVPVFIVGMPRSGTTLVEQILSAHPQLHGAGELEFMQQHVAFLPDKGTTRSISHAGRTRHLDRQQVSKIAENYLIELQKLNNGIPGIVDKLPGNYLRLGLIYLLFPNARIIHCKRDPLDTCWSCYQQNFEKGLSFTNNLEDLGYAYRDYLRLMTHWHTVLPNQILDIHYEDLLEDPDAESHRLLEHCGLDWTPEVLDFHKQNRPVSSASLWQVRQPLYKSSIGRWKAYQQHLAPLQEILSRPG